MATTRLSLYNGALLECGERALASLDEAREPRRLLDRVWDGGAVDYCLGQGQWSFARRSLQLAASNSVEPGFGYPLAFEVPSDHIRTVSLTADEFGNVPITQYLKENHYIFANVEPLYLSYVSNDASYGNDFTLWPAEFVRVVETYLASRIVKKLTQSEEKEVALEKKLRVLLADAKSGDAMEGPTKFPPPGNWVTSRHGGVRRDRGRRGDLIG